jgi:proline iminopeptidase
VEPIAPQDRGNLLAAFCDKLFGDNQTEGVAAARAWGRYEGRTIHLLPDPDVEESFGSEAVALGVGRLEAHYFSHNAFFSEDQLIRNVDRIRHLPCVIVQGRYDVICPPLSAWRLHQAWPEASFHLIADAGHGAFEPGISSALVRATEQFKREGTL